MLVNLEEILENFRKYILLFCTQCGLVFLVVSILQP
jgi:hypothetical protein